MDAGDGERAALVERPQRDRDQLPRRREQDRGVERLGRRGVRGPAEAAPSCSASSRAFAERVSTCTVAPWASATCATTCADAPNP